MPKKGEEPVDPATLPSTLQRSDAKAQRTYAETLPPAEQTYDAERAAPRVAVVALAPLRRALGAGRADLRRRGGCPPGGLCRAEARSREGGRPLGAQGAQGSIRRPGRRRRRHHP